MPVAVFDLEFLGLNALAAPCNDVSPYSFQQGAYRRGTYFLPVLARRVVFDEYLVTGSTEDYSVPCVTTANQSYAHAKTLMYRARHPAIMAIHNETRHGSHVSCCQCYETVLRHARDTTALMYDDAVRSDLRS